MAENLGHRLPKQADLLHSRYLERLPAFLTIGKNLRRIQGYRDPWMLKARGEIRLTLIMGRVTY